MKPELHAMVKDLAIQCAYHDYRGDKDRVNKCNREFTGIRQCAALLIGAEEGVEVHAVYFETFSWWKKWFETVYCNSEVL